MDRISFKIWLFLKTVLILLKVSVAGSKLTDAPSAQKRADLEHDDPIGFNVGKHMSKGVVDTPDLFFIYFFIYFLLPDLYT